ncbi:hypothetical protein NQ318_018251, partial [Aromia moschata]
TDNKIVSKKTISLHQEDDVEESYNDIPPPPDGGYGWVIVVASFMCNMVVDGISYTFGIFLSEIVRDYGETKGKTAWVGSLLTGMCMCAGPLVGILANRFGCRATCIAGSLISTAAFTMSIYCPNVDWLMLIYGFIGGTGFGLIYLPAVVCVGYYFESKRSLATGIAVCGSGVGTFAFAPLATILLEAYGWRGANLILAGIIFNCVIFGALMRPLEYPGKSKLDTKILSINSEQSEIVQGPKKASSHSVLSNSFAESRRRADSTGSFLARNIMEAENAFTSKLSLASKKSNTVQPLARKDVFYSGSILNLKEFQSQKSLASYRHSVLNVSYVNNRGDRYQKFEKYPAISATTLICILLKYFTAENTYRRLLKDPIFLFVGFSNFFGMAALYVPFVYLVDCATADGIDTESASFLLSIIGITNTIGRIACGYLADFPQVNALFVNNVCLILAAISIGFMPFCHTYLAYATISIVFAIAVSGYISLTSIILVDLLGLNRLTDAFGLLIMFRGAAALIGSPLAGALYDATQSYTIPFFVAAALFGASAIISFMVPCVRACMPHERKLQNDEILTPINQRDMKT